MKNLKIYNMKSMNKVLLLSLAFALIWGCSKVEDIVTMNPNAALSATISTPTLVLLKDNADKDAFTINWTKPDFGFDAAATYTIFIDKKGNKFANAKLDPGGSDFKKVYKTSDLNNKLISLGIPEGSTADLDIKVECLVGASTILTAPVSSLKATTYADKLDLTTIWGVVGDATTGGWNGPDLPVFKSGTANTLVAYVTLADGQIKFRRENKWDVNLGSAGTVEPDPAPSGKLLAGGKNKIGRAHV